MTTDLSGGNFGRPAINNTGGELAFVDFVEPGFSQGIFAGRSGLFRTLGPTEPNRQYRDPNVNDLGIGAFDTSFLDDAGLFFTAIVTSNQGVLSTVADTLNGYGAFGFYAPSINTRGQVAFEAVLTDFATDGVLTGPNPKKDAIITSADRLDGKRIISTSHQPLRGRTEQFRRGRLHGGHRGQHADRGSPVGDLPRQAEEAAAVSGT